nr:unnamed protein product [Digitaria exilis]
MNSNILRGVTEMKPEFHGEIEMKPGGSERARSGAATSTGSVQSKLRDRNECPGEGASLTERRGVNGSGERRRGRENGGAGNGEDGGA